MEILVAFLLAALMDISSLIHQGAVASAIHRSFVMRVFNSFQIVAAFVAWPFLIAWLSSQNFPGATAAFAAACVFYVVAFAVMVGCVASSIEKL